MNRQWFMPLSQVKMKIQVERIAGPSNLTLVSAEGKAAAFSSGKRTALQLLRLTHKGALI